nr:MAG TPA: topoisomerase domain protein [Caudoviricetes sp.]
MRVAHVRDINGRNDTSMESIGYINPRISV